MTADRTRTYMAQDSRRQQLLDLGLELFGTHAYDEVSINDIAQQADISRGLMYHYFGSKRGFYLEVIRYATDLLLEHIHPDATRSPEDNLREGLRSFFRFAEEHGQAYLMVLHSGLGFDEEVRIFLDKIRDEIVQRMLGSVPYLESTPLIHTLARGWLSSVETCVQRLLQEGDVTEDALINYLGASLVSLLAMTFTHDEHNMQAPWHETLQRALESLNAAQSLLDESQK